MRTFLETTVGNRFLTDEPSHSAYKFLRRGSEILVIDGGRVQPLVALSEIVRGMPERIWRYRVYAPLDLRGRVTEVCRQWRSRTSAPEEVTRVQLVR